MPVPAAAPRRRLFRLALALALGIAAVPALADPVDPVDALTKPMADPAGRVEPADAATEPTAAEPTLMRQVQDRASEMVVSAMNFVGVRYRRGGVSPESGFDCSGFTRHVFEMSLGLVLPRRVDEQANAPGLVAVRREDLRPGDLVFFNTLKRTFSHVGIYVGDNRFIHSPRSGEHVRTEDMGFAYWAKRFTGARRVQSPATAGPALPDGATRASVSGE
jgi:cell wall-associated NlpC family hydrolase